MGVSINWLRQYVHIEGTVEELAHRLSMAGVLVEGIEALEGDTVLELDLTPNRGDCLGMINLAREVAALTGQQVNIPTVVVEESDEHIQDYIQVDIEDPVLCPRYAARVVKDCQVRQSPLWMQQVLINSGIRPINNIVDVTNYVMLETNQPLHAFDYHLLGTQPRIAVRTARDGEPFTTLDGVKRELTSSMLVITDGEKPVALAGIMGGLDSEINADTTDVLLESANFLGTNIRKTARQLALRSESSMRFEKGADVNGVIYAVNRAAQLLQELADGQVVEGICDAYPAVKEPVQVILRPRKVNQLLGTDISPGEISGVMERLGFPYQVQGGHLVVDVPTYRPDITLEVDLIEEVARLHGFDNIPSTLPKDASRGGLNAYQKYKNRINTLMARYLNEVINYSFTSSTVFQQIQLPEDSPLRRTVIIANPLSEEHSVMRTLLLPGMLKNISTNLARRNQNLGFFEMGSVFHPSGGKLPQETLKLGAVIAGRSEANWMKQGMEMDFYYMKGILEALLKDLGTEYRLEARSVPGFHPGRTAVLKSGEQEFGVIGEIHPEVMEAFDIKERTCALELDLDQLYKQYSNRIVARDIPRYPAVERDLAMLIPITVPVADAMQVIQEAGTGLLERVSLFDVYTGAQVPEGSKSLAFRLVFQSYERTLTDSDVNELMERIQEDLEHRLRATLRS